MANTEIKVNIEASVGEAVASINTLKSEVNKMSKQVKEASRDALADELPKATKKGTQEAEDILDKFTKKAMKTMGGLFAFKTITSGIRSVAELSDEFASTKARINLMNDGLRTNEQLLRQIHDAANASRGSYMDMAASVSKLGILAGSAFANNDEIVDFVTQLNKQFTLSGASIQEASGAMYQLTQAMASGKLQGDEFHSILENAPMLAQAIADEMGVPFGKLKELSAEGAITADVIKNALISSSEETNEKFAEMPMTFGQAMTIIQNDAMQAFQGVLEQIGGMTSGENFAPLVQGLRTLFGGVSKAVGMAITVIKGAFSVFKQIFTVVSQLATNMFKILTGGYMVTIPLLAIYIGYGKQDMVMKAAQYVKTKALIAIEKSWNAVQAVGIGIKKAYHAITKTIIAVMIAYRAAMITARTTSIAFTIATNAGSIAMSIFNAVILANPIGLIIVLLAGLAAAFLGPTIAAKGLSQTLKDVWNSIVHTTVWAINKVIGFLNSLIDALNSVGKTLGRIFKVDVGQLSHIDEISSQAAESFANSVADTVDGMFNMDVTAGGGEVAGGGGGDGGGAGAGGTGGKDDAMQKMVEAAKKAHEDIENEWQNLFATKVQLADDWYTKEKAKLDESKAVNENYISDLEKLNEIYADKKQKAYNEDVEAMRSVTRQAQDLGEELRKALDATISQDKMSPMRKVEEETRKAVVDMKRHYEDLSSAYSQMTKRQQAEFLKQLELNNVAYELDGDNRLTFAETIKQRELAIYRDAEDKKTQLTREGAEERFAIEQAMRDGNFESLQLALENENVAKLEQIETQKAMMEEYVQAVKDSVFDMGEMFYNSMSQGFGAFEKGLSDALMGTKTLAQAFQSMGKAIMQSISNYIAHWISQNLKKALFEKQLNTKNQAMQAQQAAAQTTAWSSAAAMRAIADVGPIAAPGAVAGALGAIQGMASGASAMGFAGGLGASGGASASGGGSSTVRIPFMASGGVAYGATHAVIGEGQYPEAVLPLSEDTFTKLGEGINGAGGGSPIVINVSALDVDGFDSYLRGRGGSILRKFTQSQHDEFKLEGAY